MRVQVDGKMADVRLGETETPSVANTESAPAVLTGVSPTGASGGTQGTDTSFSVSIPAVGAYRTLDHRYYFNGKGPVPGVTSIIGVLDKPAIVQWAKRTVAEFAVSSLETGELVDHYAEEGKADTVKWLASLPDYQKDTAAKLGSGVHLLADMVSRADAMFPGGFKVSAEEEPYLDAFLHWLGWLQEQDGQIVSSEKMVWSEEGYAGTYDLLVRLEDQLWLLDIKTSKGYYPEYALQLIAYGYASSIILEDNPNPYPMPKVQRYGVLHLRPDQYTDTGWRLIEYPVREGDYVAFLGALEIWKWKQEGRYTKSQLTGKGKRSLKG